MNCLCLDNCMNNREKKRKIQITGTREVSSTEIQNMKLKGRSVCKAPRAFPKSKLSSISNDIYNKDKDKKIKKDVKKNIEFKKQFKCFFCGGKKCPYENYLNNPNSAIEGLNCDLIENCIYAGQRPCNFLIHKFNLVQSFISKNIGLIVNLQMQGEHPNCGPGELDHLSGFSYNPSLFTSDGIKVKIYGWREFSQPDSIDFILDIVKEISFTIKKERKRVYVHCHTGNTRTAIVVACYLIYNDKLTATDACELAKHYREKFFEKKEQKKYCKQFEEYINSLREIFTTEKMSVGWFVKNQWDLELRDSEENKANYIPNLIYKSLNRLIELKNNPKRPYSNNALYKALNGSLEITDDTFIQIKHMMKKINAGFWEAIDKCESTVIISELLFVWMDESVKYCINPNRIMKVIHNEVFTNNIDIILTGKTSNVELFYEIYTLIKRCFRKIEIEIFKFLAEFIEKVYPYNMSQGTSNRPSLKSTFNFNSGKSMKNNVSLHEVPTTFSKDDSDEYHRMLEKLSIYIVGYNIDILYNEEIIVNNSNEGSAEIDNTVSKSFGTPLEEDNEEFTLFDLMENTIKIIEFFRLYLVMHKNNNFSFELNKKSSNSLGLSIVDNNNNKLKSPTNKKNLLSNRRKSKAIIKKEDRTNIESLVNESKVNYSYYISSSLDSSDEENSEIEDEVPETTIIQIPVKRISNKKSTLKQMNSKKNKRGSVETSKYVKNVNFCLNEKKGESLNESYFFSKKRNTTSLASIQRYSQFKQNSSFQSKKSGKESNDKLSSLQPSSNNNSMGYKQNIDNKNKTKKREGDFILNKIEHNNNILIFKTPSPLQ